MTEQDFRRSRRARRQSWYGTKRWVKRALSWRVPHAVLRRVAPLLAGRIHVERLPAPARLHQVEARMAGVTFTMLHPDRCIVAKELYWGQGRRPRPEDQFALDLFAALAREASTVLDVGAYTGIFSLLAARVAPTAQVHAVEIVPDVAAAARANAAVNGVTERVTVHLVGIGRDGDEVRIARGAGGSALPDFYSADLDFADGVAVPVVSLDTLWTRVRPGAGGEATGVVVKIDVEGTEGEVLRHAQSFLAEARPDILCEVLPGRADVGAITAALAPHGYRYLRVEAGELVALSDLDPRPPWRDWLLTTRSDGELRDLGLPVRAG